jgi:hypothetical protein
MEGLRMRIVVALLAAFALVGSATAADIAKGPEYFEGTPQQHTNQLLQGDALIVSIIAGIFSDQAPAYQAALAANGKAADVIYDPYGVWGDTSAYDLVLISTADNWWDTDYSADMMMAGNFLDEGKSVWIIGQDCHWGDFTGTLDAFVTTRCGAVQVIDDVNAGDINMTILGTPGGPIGGLVDAFSACFASNDWYTDEVVPLVQGLVIWSSESASGVEGGSVSPDGLCTYSAVEFGCGNILNQVVEGLLTNCGGIVIPTHESTWGQIKNQYR